MAKAMGLFRDTQVPSWLSESLIDVPAEPSSKKNTNQNKQKDNVYLDWCTITYPLLNFKKYLKIPKG
jgi:hypothetical protein